MEHARSLRGIGSGTFPRILRDVKKPVLVTEIGPDLKHPGDELSHELAWFKNTLAVLQGRGAGDLGWAWQSGERNSTTACSIEASPTRAAVFSSIPWVLYPRRNLAESSRALRIHGGSKPFAFVPSTRVGEKFQKRVAEMC